MCKALEVSRSGYYAWRDRPPSARAREDERLGVAIRAAHAASRQTYGTRRVQAELVAQGFDAGRNRIGRLRRQMGLHCRQKRRFKVTTDSSHALPVADNLLRQRFEADAADRVWLTDLTYIATDGAGSTWPASRTSHPRDRRLRHGRAHDPQLTQQALFRAVKARRPARGLIHHGDRGSQGEFNRSLQHVLREEECCRMGSKKHGRCKRGVRPLWGRLAGRTWRAGRPSWRSGSSSLEG